jgi:hypothetical protein
VTTVPKVLDRLTVLTDHTEGAIISCNRGG